MTAIAQRRVAGATAIMILLYLLQVALFAAPAQAANINYSLYEFHFANGQTLSGSTLDDGGGLNVSVPFEGFDGREIHVSCSDVFDDGWSDSGTLWPQPSDGADWRILSYEIERRQFDDRTLADKHLKFCGETFVPGSITVVKETTPVTADGFTFDLSGTVPPAPEGGSLIEVEFDATTVAGNGGTDSWEELAAGVYTLWEVTESNPVGYAFDSVSCEDASGSIDVSTNGASVTFDLAGAQHVTCTFHNASSTQPTYGADLTIAKLVVNDPGEEGTSFDFTHTEGETDTPFSLGHGETKDFSYSLDSSEDSVTVDVTEGDPGANWSTSIQCYENFEGPALWESAISGLKVEELGLSDGDNIWCVFTNTYRAPQDFGADLTVSKLVVNDPDEEGTVFDFTHTEEGEEGDVFNLAHMQSEPFSYSLESAEDTVTVTVTEDDPGEGWSTSISCYDLNEETQDGFALIEGPVSGLSVTDLELGADDNIWCEFTNTFASTPPPPPPPPPTTLATTTTTTAPPEVAGTTITTVPEVSADTLPFTGFEAGDTVRLGLLAMLAGGLMLFAVRGRKEEEGAVTDIGGWSNL